MSEIHDSRPNRARPDEAATYVDKYDELNKKIEEECAAVDAEMKRKKSDIKKKYTEEQQGILDDGKKNGVTKTLVRALADQAKLSRKAAALQEKADGKLDALEDEDREYAVDIKKSLGADFASFGLGAAALAAHEAETPDEQDETTAAIIDAVQTDEDGGGETTEEPQDF